MISGVFGVFYVRYVAIKEHSVFLVFVSEIDLMADA